MDGRDLPDAELATVLAGLEASVDRLARHAEYTETVRELRGSIQQIQEHRRELDH